MLRPLRLFETNTYWSVQHLPPKPRSYRKIQGSARSPKTNWLKIFFNALIQTLDASDKHELIERIDGRPLEIFQNEDIRHQVSILDTRILRSQFWTTQIPPPEFEPSLDEQFKISNNELEGLKFECDEYSKC